MSRHRVKNLSYDDGDYDDDYDSTGPEDQEQLEEYISEVLDRLRTGQPSVTATRSEVQEALWHYYNDVQKSVNYLRSKTTNQARRKQAVTKKPPGATYSATSSSLLSSGHFSAVDFFHDSPWLNIPSHRKANILIEPLYPRLGLLGGAPESAGKMSKLAALAAARKKKGVEKKESEVALPGLTSESSQVIPLTVSRNDSLTLLERLSLNNKDPKLNETDTSVLARETRLASRIARGKSSLNAQKPKDSMNAPIEVLESPPLDRQDMQIPIPVDLRAPPSMFASIIIGGMTNTPLSESGHLPSGSIDVMRIYGQSLTESFDFTDPSPDDIILSAQSLSKGLKAKHPAFKPTTNKKAQTDLASGIKSLIVEEPTSVKSKNLDILAEYRKSRRKNAVNFVVIGHVDAGKSTLMGRLLADLNAVDQRTLEKYRKEAERIGKGSFALAWVLDQDSEERARGVTIDIATNKFETEKTKFTILDAPGHRDFVPNMIAGVSIADFAVLVIDASPGSFESGLRGQTREHALLARSIGVQRLVVVVNKMDTVQWSNDRFEEIEQQISSFLTTAGFLAKNISFVPCSAIRGDNVVRRSENASASWYTGRTLIEELEISEPHMHAIEEPLRITIGDVFRGNVQSPLSVSGRIDTGCLQIGDQVLVMPSGEKATIKSLDADAGESSDWAVAGQNVGLNLANIDPTHLRPGDVICSPTSPIQNIKSFTTKLLAFDHLMPMQVDIHHGRLHVAGRISQLVATLDKGTGAPMKKKPKIVPPGTVARIVVEMEQSVPLEARARIVLRAAGQTVAAGLLE